MWMAKPCNQPQVPPIAFNHNTTHHWSCTPHHTPQSTHTLNCAYAHCWTVVQRLDDYTVMTNTPWFDGNHFTNTIVVLDTLIQHITLAVFSGGAMTIPMPLCAPPVAWKAWCCACHVLPFHSFHSCPPFCPSHSLCVSLALTLCRTHSPVNE